MDRCREHMLGCLGWANGMPDADLNGLRVLADMLEEDGELESSQQVRHICNIHIPGPTEPGSGDTVAQSFRYGDIVGSCTHHNTTSASIFGEGAETAFILTAGRTGFGLVGEGFSDPSDIPTGPPVILLYHLWSGDEATTIRQTSPPEQFKRAILWAIVAWELYQLPLWAVAAGAFKK